MIIRIDSDIATTGDLLQLEIRLNMRFDQLTAQLQQLEARMNTLDDLVELARSESTVIDSLLALIRATHQEVMDILSGAAVPAKTQAKVDAAFGVISQDKAKLEAAILENTPQEPPPGPTP